MTSGARNGRNSHEAVTILEGFLCRGHKTKPGHIDPGYTNWTKVVRSCIENGYSGGVRVQGSHKMDERFKMGQCFVRFCF